MRRLLLCLSIVSATITAPVGPASACSCILLTPKEKAKRADVVFTGRVLRIGEPSDGLVVARFGVRVLFKGMVTRRVNVTTASDEAACGCRFRVGRRYTVFAYHPDGGGLATDLCSGTRRGRIDHDRYGLPRGTPP